MGHNSRLKRSVPCPTLLASAGPQARERGLSNGLRSHRGVADAVTFFKRKFCGLFGLVFFFLIIVRLFSLHKLMRGKYSVNWDTGCNAA